MNRFLNSLPLVFLLASRAAAQIQSGRIVGTVTDPHDAAIPGARVVITSLGQSARADATLRIGETSTTVEVVSTTPLLNTESGTLGQEITNKQIVDLPLNGRSFYELARMTPGATLLPGTGNLLRIRANFESGTSISGVRGNQTSFFLDGVDATDHDRGGTLIQTSIDALQEFQIQQSEYKAEFRNAGGVLNGSTGNQFGGGIGGPLRLPKIYNGTNRTFFFVNYEAMRQRAGQVFNSLVPSAAQKAGDFSAPGLNVIHDPATKAPFAGNIIPASQISPQALFFAKYIPNPNAGNRAIFAPSAALDQDQFTIRIDQTITSNHKAFVRWSFINYQENDPNAFPALGYASLNTRGQNVVGALISNLAPSVINEARFSYLPNSVDLQVLYAGHELLLPGRSARL